MCCGVLQCILAGPDVSVLQCMRECEQHTAAHSLTHYSTRFSKPVAGVLQVYLCCGVLQRILAGPDVSVLQCERECVQHTATHSHTLQHTFRQGPL